MIIKENPDETTKIFYVEFEGDLKMSEKIPEAPEMINSARANHYNKFLFDVRYLNVNFSLFDSYHLMQHLDCLGLKRSDTVALVYKCKEELFKFSETVANNRGWQKLKVFCDYNEGEKWLLS